jgi:hypothetical protein
MSQLQVEYDSHVTIKFRWKIHCNNIVTKALKKDNSLYVGIHNPLKIKIPHISIRYFVTASELVPQSGNSNLKPPRPAVGVLYSVEPRSISCWIRILLFHALS